MTGPLSNRELTCIAKALEVPLPFEGGREQLIDVCFEAAYTACRAGLWHRITPIAGALSRLVNTVGHTLIIRAVIRGESETASQLADRDIGQLSSDPMGNIALHYIQAGVVDACAQESFIAHLVASTKRLSVECPGRERLQRIIGTQKEARSWGDEGLLAYQNGNYPRAKQLYTSLLEWYQSYFGNRHPHCAEVLYCLGNVHEKLKEYEAAKNYHGQALAVGRNCFGGEDGRIARFLNGMGSACSHEYATRVEAKRYYEEALSLAQRHQPQHVIIAHILSNLGNLLCELGDFQGSITRHNDALKVYGQLRETAEWNIGMQNEFAEVVINLASAHGRSSDYRKAHQLFLSGLGVLERGLPPSHPRVMGVLWNLAEVSLELRDAKKYEEYRDRIQKLIQELQIQDPVMKSRLCFMQARFFLNNDRGENARSTLELGLLDLDARIPAHISCIAQLSSCLGNVCNQLGDHEAALECHRRADCVLREHLAEDHPDRMRILDNLANTCGYMGNSSEAIGLSRKSLALRLKQLGQDHPDVANSRNNLGNLLLSAGQINEAAMHLEEALRIRKCKEVPLSNDLMMAYQNLGNLYICMGDHERAENCYRGALELTAAHSSAKAIVLMGLGNAQADAGKMEEAIGSQTKAVEMLACAQTHDALSNVHAALGCTYAKGGRHLEAEAQFRIAVGLSATDQAKLTRDEWKVSIFEQQAVAYRHLEAVLLLQNKSDEALVVADQRRSRALVSTLRARVPAMQEPFTLQTMRDLASLRNTAFVVYSHLTLQDGKKVISIWVISPGMDVVHKLIEDTGNLKQCEDYESKFPYLSTSRQEIGRGPEQSDEQLPEDLQRNLGRFKRKLQAWYTTLISPIADALPRDIPITFVPDGFVATAPFALFSNAEGRYLIEDHAVSVVPSIEVAYLLHHLKEGRTVSEGAMIVGNPAVPQLAPLPKADEEAARVFGIIGGSEPPQTGENATVLKITEKMQQVRWIHFACHGQSNIKPSEHSVYQGGLRLCPDESAPRGYLCADAVSKMHLNADLVFMSACESGRGNMQQEGVVGLVRSFLAAGTLSAVATYWKLPDTDLTVGLAEEFYQLISSDENISKAEALRRVMLKAIEQDRFSPHIWGACFLNGLN